MLYSPLDLFCKQQDLNYLGNESEDQYFADALKIWVTGKTPENNQFNKLFVKGAEFKAKNKENFVFSTYGSQGSGKSLSTIAVLLKLSELFETDFAPKQICFMPNDFMAKIKKLKFKEALFQDEQRQSVAGYMSRMISDTINDFADQLRINQNNLAFASPDLRVHSHFMILKPFQIIRNADGYPAFFVVEVRTKHLYIDTFYTRGFLSVPMPPIDFVEEYTKRKEKHIEFLKSRKGGSTQELDEDADFIVNNYFDKLVINGKLIQKEGIKTVVWKEIGMTKYPIKIYDVLYFLIKQKVTEKLNEA